MNSPTWDLSSAIELCRHLWMALEPIKMHCALTGSVLYRGFSKKDVDIIIYPHDVAFQAEPDEVWAKIEPKLNYLGFTSSGSYSNASLSDCFVRQFQDGIGRRIDVFVMSKGVLR